jgi:exodeoxyribonuclease VII large subunit
MAPNSPNLSASGPPDAEIWTVSRLTREARRLLETGLARIWIEGEISNLARPASGHIYFSLKDEQAQVRCAMFRSANRRLRFTPENGSRVLVEAKVSLYEARGEFQLIAERLEDAGEGLLRRKFEELKARLTAEGLFDTERKQAIPALPGTIGIVTSPTGAAVRDILQILRRRYPGAGVVIYSTRVQGEGSAEEIVAAITAAQQRNEVDVLIVARGGGSLEDLWSFNEEIVARALFDCQLPTVAGIGHEVDVTIADLVADVRAPTPSGAAELVAPERDELLRSLAGLMRSATLAIRRQVAVDTQQHKQLAHRLQLCEPGAVISQARLRLDELDSRLREALQDCLEERGSAYAGLLQRLRTAAPHDRIAYLLELLTLQRQRLQRGIRQRLQTADTRFAATSANLHAVSPLATLNRGYAIVSGPTDKIVTDAGKLAVGDNVRTRLATGEFEAAVTKVIGKKS